MTDARRSANGPLRVGVGGPVDDLGARRDRQQIGVVAGGAQCGKAGGEVEIPRVRDAHAGHQPAVSSWRKASSETRSYAMWDAATPVISAWS